MFTHKFLFSGGNWIGEGSIQLSNVEEVLVFYTRWKSTTGDPDLLEVDATQEIQVAGHTDIMLNQYLFSNFDGKRFEVELENQAWGKVFGEGIIDDGFIGWEFRDNDLGFEGYEYYQLQQDGSCEMKGEYATGDEFKTLIQGKIWKQTKQE
ncbi:MAG: hypothetical protein HY860_03610 [Chlamydiales bacterium]|nr:hypothetical protein [Chlamydiales bacterium]